MRITDDLQTNPSSHTNIPKPGLEALAGVVSDDGLLEIDPPLERFAGTFSSSALAAARNSKSGIDAASS
jgi:hypothetical protein